MPKPCSRWINPTVVDQRSAGTETTDSNDSDIFNANTTDEDCDSDTGKITKPHMQCGNEDAERGLGGVTSFMETNSVASTLKWREGVLHSQGATQVTTSSSRQQPTAKKRWQALLDMVLWGAIKNLEQKREYDLKQLKDGEEYYIPRWEEVPSDYQPTECGNE